MQKDVLFFFFFLNNEMEVIVQRLELDSGAVK